MKLKDGFMLRDIAGTFVVVPLGERVVDFNGILTLNETGAYLWDRFSRGDSCVDASAALASAFDVSEVCAKADTEDFLSCLERHSLIES